MKPLSARKYFSRNKKSLISSMIAVILAIALIYGLNCFLESMFLTNYNTAEGVLNTSIQVLKGREYIPKDDIEKIKSIEGVEKVVPFIPSQLWITTVGNYANVQLYGFYEEDREYVLNKLKVNLIEGRFPKEGTNEIAIDKKVALNRKVGVGDNLEEYKIVGILEGQTYFSIKALSDNNENKNYDRSYVESIGMLIFPQEGEYDGIVKYLVDNSNDKYNYGEIGALNRDFNRIRKETSRIFDLLTVFVIVVNVVTLACIKYAQFIDRKSQYGLLMAIGYSKKEIMKSAVDELIFINIVASIIGVICGYILASFLVRIAFVSIGGIGVYLTKKAVVYALLTPIFTTIFTTIFTLIPIFKGLNSMDSISIVEED